MAAMSSNLVNIKLDTADCVEQIVKTSSSVTSGVGIPTFSRYTDRLGKLAGILLL